MAKKTMHHLLSGQAFMGDFHQLETLLARIAWLLNSTPVAARSFTDTDFYLVTPNDVILGRAARGHDQIPSIEEMDESSLGLGALTHMEKVARAWHASFMKQVWPLLQARGKWQDQRQNVHVGNI